MMDLFFTKEQKWLSLWDKFLKDNPRGHNSQYSAWLQSYTKYGFDYRILLLVENDTIIGGCGLIIPKLFFFKFVVVPAGPIVHASYEHTLNTILTEINQFAISISACYLQITLPKFSQNLDSDYTISVLNGDSFYHSGLIGTKFKYVIAADGFRFVDLTDKNPQKKYSTNTKRNIKKALDAKLEFDFARDEDEIREAYQCIIQNAKRIGYSVRSFDDFETTLKKLIDSDQAIFAVCKFDKKIIGSLFLINCGQRFTYISGGTDRHYNHFKVGHFLHHKIIELSMECNYAAYDISVGGDTGVLRFKEGFGGKHLTFIGTKYWILKPILFKIFLFFEQYFKPYKATVAALLSKLNKK